MRVRRWIRVRSRIWIEGLVRIWDLIWGRERRKVGRVVREVGRKWWKVREGRVSF